jgi:magnesium-transporting ATPase (P-type)
MSCHSAVVESRRIFRKLKSYVTYRFAASMQIVIVLTLLIYISNCPIDSVSIHAICSVIVTFGLHDD